MGLYTGDNKRGNNKIKNCMVLQTGGLYRGEGRGLIYGVLRYYMIFLHVYFRKTSNMKKC